MNTDKSVQFSIALPCDMKIQMENKNKRTKKSFCIIDVLHQSIAHAINIWQCIDASSFIVCAFTILCAIHQKCAN